MTNTMADLRQEVSRRLRDTLHGREIDIMEKGKPELEHMLGIVTLGAISTPEAEKGTLLDPKHSFWQEYHETVNTPNAVRREIETTIYSLKEDDIFRVTSPYGDDAGILYVEVDDMSKTTDGLRTECAECGATIDAVEELTIDYGTYRLLFRLDCPECSFEETVGRELHTQ